MSMTTTLRMLFFFVCVVSNYLPNCSCFVPTSNTLFSRKQRINSPPQLHLRSHRDETRGEFLRRGGNIILFAPSLINQSQVANAVETPAEASRLLSAKSIPGLGPPDVYYPPYFVGKWRVTKVISKSDDVFWNGVDLPLTVVSEMRFVPYDSKENFAGDENSDNIPAIADRSFNERSYYASLSQKLSAKSAMPSIQSLNWSPNNPNVLSLAYADGSSKEVKVTKRSSDVSKDGSGVFSSEFRSVTAVPAPGGIAGGIPKIYNSRLITKWKQAGKGASINSGGVDIIEGIEITYNEQGTMGDKDADPLLGGGGGNAAVALLFGGDTKNLPDWRSTETKILMERVVG